MNLLNQTPAEARATLQDLVKRIGVEGFRVNQIHRRLWQRPAASWESTSNLPAAIVRTLEAEFPILRPVVVSRQVSNDGTVKFLWKLIDGALIESVVIPEGNRRTLCISSQVGCAFACVFCATGAMGFGRNLEPWEITAQVREMILLENIRPNNVVFMGMGEPLHNWGSVNTALTILNDREGLGIGARHITVSTVGLIPQLAELAARREQFRLAVSLHAPTSRKRAQIMPVERKYPLPALVDGLRKFRRRITFEYVMIAGVNDTDSDAADLAELAAELGAMVNLIPLHPGAAAEYKPTDADRMHQFARLARSRGVNVTLRRSRGLDISAACGQLRVDFEGMHKVDAQ